MLKDLLPTLISSGITAYLAYMAGRRKANAEAANLEIKSAQEVIALWKDLNTTLRNEVEDLRLTVNELKKENMVLKQALKSLDKRSTAHHG